MKFNKLNPLWTLIYCLTFALLSDSQCAEEPEKKETSIQVVKHELPNLMKPDFLVSTAQEIGFSYYATMAGKEIGSRVGKYIALAYLLDVTDAVRKKVETEGGSFLGMLAAGAMLDTLGPDVKTRGEQIGALFGTLGAASALFASPYIWNGTQYLSNFVWYATTTFGYYTRTIFNYCFSSDYFKLFKTDLLGRSLNNTNESVKYSFVNMINRFRYEPVLLVDEGGMRPGKIYVNEKTLEYLVLNQKDEKKQGKLNIKGDGKVTQKLLNDQKSQILEQLSVAGHINDFTYRASPIDWSVTCGVAIFGMTALYYSYHYGTSAWSFYYQSLLNVGGFVFKKFISPFHSVSKSFTSIPDRKLSITDFMFSSITFAGFSALASKTTEEIEKKKKPDIRKQEPSSEKQQEGQKMEGEKKKL